MISMFLAMFGAPAVASAPAVDLLVKPLTAQTHPVVADTEFLDVFGQALLTRVSPDLGGLGHRGLLAEVSGIFPAFAPNRWVVSTGWSHARTRYVFDGLTFAPTTMDMHLTAGILPWFYQQKVPVVDGYMVVLAGVHAQTLSAQPISPTQIAFAPQLTGGLGIGTRQTSVRVRLETRVDFVLHFSPGDGRVELPSRAFVWRWYPASAAISVLLGVGFGGGEQ